MVDPVDPRKKPVARPTGPKNVARPQRGEAESAPMIQPVETGMQDRLNRGKKPASGAASGSDKRQGGKPGGKKQGAQPWMLYGILGCLAVIAILVVIILTRDTEPIIREVESGVRQPTKEYKFDYVPPADDE